jgi:hypothetical protein
MIEWVSITRHRSHRAPEEHESPNMLDFSA